MSRLRIAVLGCTGSIGSQTLDIVRLHRDRLEVVALAAHANVNQVLKQAHEFNVSHIAFGDDSPVGDPMLARAGFLAGHEGVTVGYGREGVLELVRRDDVDLVVNALVGAAGMHVSYEALASGKRLALANKESLVVAGELIMPLAAKLDARLAAVQDLPEIMRKPSDRAAQRPAGKVGLPGMRGALMPIDSEHGAIYQCLLGEDPREVSRLWVTASGGPFRGKSREELSQVTREQALSHPTWSMGRKITVDSATLMNKGLEVIEAHHLFSMPYERIRVVVHPQSVIHSMVEFADGSVKAHLGTTDMKIPIQFALSYPERWHAPVAPLDFTQLGDLEFQPPDTKNFPCLLLANRAGRVGGTLPCAMNAANEVAVDAFLKGACHFLHIQACVEHVMERHEAAGVQRVESLEQLAEVDAVSREEAQRFLSKTVKR